MIREDLKNFIILTILEKFEPTWGVPMSMDFDTAERIAENRKKAEEVAEAIIAKMGAGQVSTR